MAANHGAATTSNSEAWSSQGAMVLWSAKNWLTFSGATPRGGRNDPGTVPRAIRNSSTWAVRIEVSCRHPQRSQPTMPIPSGRSRGAWGEASAAGASVLVVTGSPPSDLRVEAGYPALHLDRQVRPGAGDQEQPARDAHAAAAAHHRLVVPFDEPERAQRPAV